MSSAVEPTPSIVITGVGLVTPLGHSAWQTFAALLEGRTLTDRAQRLPPDIQPVEMVRALGCVSVAQHAATDPSLTLAEMAAREALFMAGEGSGPIPAILGASKGTMQALTAAAINHCHLPGKATSQQPAGLASMPFGQRFSPKESGGDAASTMAVTLGPHGYLASQLRQRLGLGSIRSVVAACASSLTALHQGRIDLLHAPADAPRRLLVVTSEAALLPMFIHSYARLGVLPPLNPHDYRGLPLDGRRCGFMLAELGAAVVLERVDHPHPGQIELLDTAIASESFDLVRPAPGMPALGWIAGRLLTNHDVDLLHPHATGTPDNDQTELAVYADLLRGQRLPDVYAHKGAIGHGLGAAGLVSVVLAWLCARSNRRPPMPWLGEPMESILPVARDQPVDAAGSLRTQAIFAAGFGGHVAGAIIRRV